MSGQIGLTDIAANKDLFEIGSYIDGLADFIKECKTPMTISIQGTWGTGKTSIMRMIEEKIESPTYQCVDFNTWEFSQFNLEKNISVVMIQSLIASLSGEDKTSEETMKGVVTLLASIGAGFLSNGATINFKELEKGYLKQIKSLKSEFQLLVNKRIGLVDYTYKLGKNPDRDKEVLDMVEGNKRIVFFIDDLDRLNPERAVELLEVLKNFLDCKNCVFVLAIDYDVVWRGVALKYKSLPTDDPEDVKKKGRDFFDKIIQVPFKMPVASYQVDNYLLQCLKEIKVPVEDHEIDIYIDLLKRSIGTNPRSLKRIINSFALLIKVIGKSDLEKIKGYKLLFAVLCMQHAFEKLYNYFVSNRENITLEHLERLAYGNMDEINSLFPELEITAREFSDVRPFMDVFFNRAIDIDNNGVVDISGKNDETAALRTILGMSSITGAGTDTEKRQGKRRAEAVTLDKLERRSATETEVKHIIDLVNGSIDDDKVSVEYVNTSGYSHAIYRYNKKTFCDVVFYDDRRRAVEVDCTPKNGEIWDRPESAEIIKRYGELMTLRPSYLQYKGIHIRYCLIDAPKRDEDVSALVSACYRDAKS